MLAICALAACGAPASTPATSAPQPAIPANRLSVDSTATLVPPNRGTLKQDDIAITLQSDVLRVTVIPLDEAVIRVLAPDSYRALRSTLDDRRRQVEQRAQAHGFREARVWYASYYGLSPNVRFVPTDLTVTSGGRDFRPFDVIPISNGFGLERLQARETQRGLLLFEEGVDADQPLVVSIGVVRNTDWSNEVTLGKIENERAAIRARSGRTPPLR